MIASEFRVGKKLIHKELKTTLEVKEIDGKKFWMGLELGGIFTWVDYVNE